MFAFSGCLQYQNHQYNQPMSYARPTTNSFLVNWKTNPCQGVATAISANIRIIITTSNPANR